MSDENNLQPGNSIEVSKYLDFCWKYFALQSDQRMKMLQFFITIETLIIGALFTLILKYPTYRWMMCVVDLSILFTSLSFLWIDNRSRNMIKWCSDCICKIESSYIDKNYQLFNYSKAESEKTKFIPESNKAKDKSKSEIFKNTYTFWIRFYCISIIILSVCMLIFFVCA